MTIDEFLSGMKSRGAIISAPATRSAITLANSALQQMGVAMMPMSIANLYEKTGGINLGTAYIFGPTQITYRPRTTAPAISQLNFDLRHLDAMHAKTIFGRNDLFWFAFDAFGKFFMLDNTTLREMRQYDDPFQAMTDCLMGGLI